MNPQPVNAFREEKGYSNIDYVFPKLRVVQKKSDPKNIW